LLNFKAKLLEKEQTIVGLKVARGENIDRRFQLSKAQVRLLQVTMKNGNVSETELGKELNITRVIFYKYLDP